MNRIIYCLVLLVLAATVFFRFYKVADLGYFMMDEERDAFLVRRMLVDGRPLLIGGSIPGGINVGPAFFYISAIPYYLSRLNPVGPAWAAGMIGVIGVIGVFWTGKRLFGKRVAILATIFSTFSLLNIIYHRPWWPLTMSQAVTLTVYLSLFKLIDISRLKTDKNRWLLCLTLVLIVGAQSDPSTLSLIPLSAIWLWRHRRRIELTGKHYLAAAGLFLLAHATWVIFEFRHDFQSSRTIASLFNNSFKGLTFADAKVRPYELVKGFFSVLKMTAATVYRLFIPTGPLDVTGQISPAEVFLNQRLSGIWWPLAWIMLILIVLYAIFYSRKTNAIADRVCENRTIISWHFLISLAGISVYTMLFPGYVHEWMWFFMFPGFFLMVGDLLVRLAKLGKFAEFAISTAVLGWAIWQMSLFIKLDNVAGLGKKLAVVKSAQVEIAGRPYELRSEGEGALRYGGWRYLFTLYGDPPVKSYMDYVYVDWLYPKSEFEPQLILTVINSVDKAPHSVLEEFQGLSLLRE